MKPEKPIAPPLLIGVAPNGAKRGKEDHPSLPISAPELAMCAKDCSLAGASLFHLHVRDAVGHHSLDIDAYRTAIAAIRAEVGKDLLLQVTTEAAGVFSRHEQMTLLRELRPEAASLALREFWPENTSPSVEKDAREFFAWLAGTEILPQFILYSPLEVERFVRLYREGCFGKRSPFLLFVSGRHGGKCDTTSQPPFSLPPLAAWLASLNGLSAHWMACGFGDQAPDFLRETLAAGGHVRVGFENSLSLLSGAPAPDNAALIREIREAAAHLSRPVVGPEEAKKLLM